MKPFHSSIFPDPLALYALTSATLRKKMIKDGAKVSLSSRGPKVIDIPLSMLENFSKERDSDFYDC